MMPPIKSLAPAAARLRLPPLLAVGALLLALRALMLAATLDPAEATAAGLLTRLRPIRSWMLLAVGGAAGAAVAAAMAAPNAVDPDPRRWLVALPPLCQPWFAAGLASPEE